MPHTCLHSSATSSCRICTVCPFCTTEHARRSSWLHSHHRLQAFPAVNGCTGGGRYPFTCPPTGRYHSTDSGKPKAITSGTVLLVPSCYGRFVPAAAVEKDLLILEPILLSRHACFGGAHTMSPRVKPSGRVHKGHCQVTSCRKRGLVNTRGGVHRVADCQPPQLDAVGEELAVIPINLNRGDSKESRKEMRAYHLLQWRAGRGSVRDYSLDILPFDLHAEGEASVRCLRIPLSNSTECDHRSRPPVHHPDPMKPPR